MTVKNWAVGCLEKVAKISKTDAASAGHKIPMQVCTGITFVAFLGGMATILSQNPTNMHLATQGSLMAGFAAAFVGAAFSTAAIMALDLEKKSERAVVAFRDGAQLTLDKLMPSNDFKALNLFSALTSSAVEMSQRNLSQTSSPRPKLDKS